ncbi:GNAT family N-acetyltransferase [Saccharibacillus sp. JS10]|uniref:GNAT family N-acetyltransferase n=1 Tax=Saccharibacillus sp. JS10 TaxID=2950552 RepID=UPI00210D0292|nr:GNAT family N-acetyltransferase [Saccharibacillus sp. JS10]MCQ4085463.1 GNAT family N-acetyltransferase [Saccharibacillus sp. JS10]
MNFLVVNKQLAKEIQQSEIEYFHSRISSIGEKSGNPEGVEIKKFVNATAFYIQSMPWALFNSVKGISENEIDRLEEMIEFYQTKERKFQVEVDPINATPSLLRELSEKGLFQESFQSVLYGLPSQQNFDFSPEITIKEIKDAAHFEDFAGIHCVASGIDLVHKHHFVNNNIGLLHRKGWRLFLAYWNEQPAAVGVMYNNEKIASFTLAATAPEFRKKGLQTALLKWRMNEAYRAGCELIVAQASSGSSSQNNMERIGLRMAWTRAIWVSR